MRTEYELLPGSKQWNPGGERAFRFRTGYTAALQAQTAAQTPLLSLAGWLWLLYLLPQFLHQQLTDVLIDISSVELCASHSKNALDIA